VTRAVLCEEKKEDKLLSAASSEEAGSAPPRGSRGGKKRGNALTFSDRVEKGGKKKAASRPVMGGNLFRIAASFKERRGGKKSLASISAKGKKGPPGERFVRSVHPGGKGERNLCSSPKKKERKKSSAPSSIKRKQRGSLLSWLAAGKGKKESREPPILRRPYHNLFNPLIARKRKKKKRGEDLGGAVLSILSN